MDKNNIKNLTDVELVDIAGKSVIGTVSGLESQYAQAEINRRLMDSINNLNKETGKYSKVLINLTWLLFAIGIIQLIITIIGPAEDWIQRSIYIVAILVFLYFIIRLITKKQK